VVRTSTVSAPEFDDPTAIVERRGNVYRSSSAGRVDGGRQCARRIDHQKVSRLEYVRQILEPPVLDMGRPSDEQPDTVAGQPALLGRRGGGLVWRDIEGDHTRRRVHAVAAGISIPRSTAAR
jgi:hypothetical protein